MNPLYPTFQTKKVEEKENLMEKSYTFVVKTGRNPSLDEM